MKGTDVEKKTAERQAVKKQITSRKLKEMNLLDDVVRLSEENAKIFEENSFKWAVLISHRLRFPCPP